MSVADPPSSPGRPMGRVVGVVVLLLPLGLLAVAGEYRGSSDVHSAIEVLGGVFGLIAGLTLVSRSLAFDDRLQLLAGVGFVANASADLLHGLVPFLALRGVSALPASTLDRFVPGSFLAGRLMAALALLVAPWLGRRLRAEVTRRDAAGTFGGVVVLGLAVTLAVYALPLPRFLYPARVISRPADLVVALLFLAATIVLWRAYRAGRDPVLGWVVAAAAFSVVGQLVISTSSALYDAAFDLGHLYKVVSYAIPLVAVSLYQVQLQVRLAAANERLRDLDAAKTEFLSVVSHELKTPLTAVVGFASLLDEYWATIPEPQRLEHIDAIRRQGQRLQRLIDDLLLLTSLEAGQVRPQPAAVALREHVEALVRARTIEVAEVDVDDAAVVEADAGHVTTILQHFVENAEKYGAAPIRISGWRDGERVTVVVDDAGAGVPETIRDRIFRDRFVQGDRGETRSSTGTGLGLAIVASLAGLNGAAVFHETSPTGGARFGVRLPAVATAAVPDVGTRPAHRTRS